MKSIITTGVVATGLLLGSGMASAETVVETGPGSGIATGILDLDVGGTLYNVEFVANTTANGLYGGVYDFNGASDASDAIDAIIIALNAATISLVGPNVTDAEAEFRIGFLTLGTDVRTQVSRYSPPWTNDGSEIAGGNSFSATYADFTVVPEPTMEILLSTPGEVTISWNPDTPGFVLQETISLTPAQWTNSPSGSTNPITVPTTEDSKFYRLLGP
jgi:hypothetical protein